MVFVTRFRRALADKAEVIKATIRRQSFNGKFLKDNGARKNGKLVRTGHTSEACQHHAFSLGIADKNDYPELYKVISADFTDKNGNGFSDEKPVLCEKFVNVDCEFIIPHNGKGYKIVIEDGKHTVLSASECFFF